jgi:hypothetical protein
MCTGCRANFPSPHFPATTNCCAALCCAVLWCRLYEEVEPAKILDERAAASGSSKEYLVQYKVRAHTYWLPQRCAAENATCCMVDVACCVLPAAIHACMGGACVHSEG